MSLPDHLHPKTYWEQRCELCESAVFELLKILHNTGTPQQQYAINDFAGQWDRNLTELTSQFPPPDDKTHEVAR